MGDVSPDPAFLLHSEVWQKHCADEEGRRRGKSPPRYERQSPRSSATPSAGDSPATPPETARLF